MRRVVVDASALASVVFQEPGFERIAEQLDGAAVFAPSLLKFELINTAWKKARRTPSDAPHILAALAIALADTWNVVWQDVEPIDVALIAISTGMTGYDASYLWLAGALGADLVTLDSALARFESLI